MSSRSTATVSRLFAVLVGFGPAATLVLLVTGLLGRQASISGATLSLMGLALGVLSGVTVGGWYTNRIKTRADELLPVLFGLLFLPLALAPAQPDLVTPGGFGSRGWLPVFLGVIASVPLGLSTGISWRTWRGKKHLRGEVPLWWIAIGCGLGILVSLGAALILSMFKGSFLVILFVAPLVWPVLPNKGERSLLARMLLTLLVVVATMFMLFM